MRSPTYNFEAVNDFVHCQDALYEELQCLCLGMATEIDRMQWQPIETAPRNGDRILVYRPLAEMTHNDSVVIGHGVPDDMGCSPQTVPPGMDRTNYTDGYCKATHWMAIPDPPRLEASGGNSIQNQRNRHQK